jgi:hypothetical protein
MPVDYIALIEAREAVEQAKFEAWAARDKCPTPYPKVGSQEYFIYLWSIGMITWAEAAWKMRNRFMPVPYLRDVLKKLNPGLYIPDDTYFEDEWPDRYRE